MNTASILGVQFHAVTKQQAVELAMSKIRSRQKGYVVTPNPEIVDLCRHDEKFMGVVNHATLVLPDGIGIIYAAKILGEKLHGKVAGIEFAESLVAAMAKENMRLYLLGAKPGVAEKAGANLCAKYPGLVLAGTHDGYFSDPQKVVDSINAAGAEVILAQNDAKINVLDQLTGDTEAYETVKNEVDGYLPSATYICGTMDGSAQFAAHSVA